MCCFFIFQIICYAIFYAVNLTCHFVAKESKDFECLRYAEQNGNKYLIIRKKTGNVSRRPRVANKINKIKIAYLSKV